MRKVKWYFKSAIRGIRGWAAKFPNKVRVYRFIQMDSLRGPRDVHLGTGYSAWLICKMIEAGIKPGRYHNPSSPQRTVPQTKGE